MGGWSYIEERWPRKMLAVRRECAIDPSFRELVSDYDEARSALQRWLEADPAGSVRITDFERLVRDLEAEIEERIGE